MAVMMEARHKTSSDHVGYRKKKFVQAKNKEQWARK
jgi:hypothetical protein